MGFFDKLKRKKKIGNWEDAYIAAPNFYEKPDGTPFGAIALTEGRQKRFYPNHRRIDIV